MPRKAKQVPDDAIVERQIPIKGWVYNLMVTRGEAQHRSAKYQIAHELERLAEQLRAEGEKSPGNFRPKILKAA
jgi:hypothetical protein